MVDAINGIERPFYDKIFSVDALAQKLGYRTTINRLISPIYSTRKAISDESKLFYRTKVEISDASYTALHCFMNNDRILSFGVVVRTAQVLIAMASPLL
jgi:hypothetical protein